MGLAIRPEKEQKNTFKGTQWESLPVILQIRNKRQELNGHVGKGGGL